MISAQDFTTTSLYKDLIEAQNNDPYKDSPFYSIRILTSKTKGSVFEKITKNYLKDKLGMIITKNESPNHDIVANNVKIEVKGSSFWSDGKGGGSKFRWQQIRLAQDYDVIIFLAMYPDTIKFYYATKQDLLDNINLPKYNQHGGKKVDSGTKCIDGFPEDFPWMKEIVDGSFISKQ